MSPDSSSSTVALPSVGVVPAERARPDMRLLGLLALGHMVIDINQGSLPAILPIVKDALNLSYAATGVIVLTANITSSMIQPLFGYLADKTAVAGCSRCLSCCPRSGSPSPGWLPRTQRCSRW